MLIATGIITTRTGNFALFATSGATTGIILL